MLQDLYCREIANKMRVNFGYKNVMQVPRLQKICLNMGLGKYALDQPVVTKAIEDLSLIAGQRAVFTCAKKSVAAFKLRQGMRIGCKVTLRGKMMYCFLERLIYLALPREKDLRPLNDSNISGDSGTCSFGIKEHISFPEINYEAVTKILGLDVTIVCTPCARKECKFLLMAVGLPFVRHDVQ